MLKTTVIGNLGRDAEIQDVNGHKAIKFSLAHSEKYLDKNGVKQDRTIWVNCTLWRKQGESMAIAEYLKKGQQVYCEGTPSVSPYYSQKQAQWFADFSLRVRDVQLLGGKKDDKPDTPPISAETRPNEVLPPVNIDDDDLPF